MFLKSLFKFLFVGFLFLPFAYLSADGGMIPYYYPDGKDIYEPSQKALIIFDEGKEDLYIEAGYEGEAGKFVWIVPTPSYPKVEVAPKDIFKELSVFTNDGFVIAEDKIDAFNNAEGERQKQDVILHEQKQVGIYEISVLSAVGADGLYTWLEENNYFVKEDIKDVLDWYVKKEWYFTAMKINSEAIIEEVIEKLKREVVAPITKENLAQELFNYYLNSLKEGSFEDSKKAASFILSLSFDNYFYDLEDLKDMSEEDFNDSINELSDEEIEDFIENESEDFIANIQEAILQRESGDIEKYGNYIEPIKISFQTNSIIYPLKISQISTRVPENFQESKKTNEVLLYVLSNEQIKAPGFDLEFAEGINFTKLEKVEELIGYELSGLREVLRENDYFLTKMRRYFSKMEMNEDLYFAKGEMEDKEKLKVHIFSSESCPYCKKAEDFISDIRNNFRRDVDFVFYDILDEEDKKIFEDMSKSLGVAANGVPFIVIENEYILGFGSPEDSGKKIVGKINQFILNPLKEAYDKDATYLKEKNKVTGLALSDRLKGKILIKVEDDGKAYYINPVTKYYHYLGRPDDAFRVMREQGVGISNVDLKKIPIGLNGLEGDDSDSDGLPDIFEDAIGTDKHSADTDGDDYSDKDEIEYGYDPLSRAGLKLPIDLNFSEKQKGKIFLQVENSGEAWYVNPEDGKRYFLGRPDDAFNVMRNLGLGINNKDFEALAG